MKDEDILKIARETDSEQYYFSEGWVLAFARRILAAAIPEGMVLVGWLDGRSRFFYADDLMYKNNHEGMREVFAAATDGK